MTKLSRTTACVSLLLGVFAAGPGGAAPKEIRATYNGYMNGLTIGVISERFVSEGGTYRIVSDTRPLGLATLLQRRSLRFESRGVLTREGLKPDQFEARRSAAEPPQVSAEFMWKSAEVVLKHDGRSETHKVVPGTQDRLSIMYQLMLMPLARAQHIDFAMTNGRKLDNYRYRITHDVEIDTPLGRMSTLHLVKQRDPGDSATEVWLSKSHRHFPVKIVIVEDGLRFEQVIQALEIRD